MTIYKYDVLVEGQCIYVTRGTVYLRHQRDSVFTSPEGQCIYVTRGTVHSLNVICSLYYLYIKIK
jgi:mannose-6-phosphate isomerase-like protein (cupin superfamily)